MPPLSSPSWTGIGVIIAFLAFIIGDILVPFLLSTQNKKQITSEIISVTPVIDIRKTVKSKIQTLLNNQSLGNISLIVLKVENTGKSAIKIADYETDKTDKTDKTKEPIQFNFGNEAEILDVKILNPIRCVTPIRKPSSDSRILAVEPLTLNEKASFTCSVLVMNFDNEIWDETSLVEVKQILKANVYNRPIIKNILTITILLSFLSMIIFSSLSSILIIFFKSVFSVSTRVSFPTNLAISNSFLFGGVLATLVVISLLLLYSLLPKSVQTSKQRLGLNEFNRLFLQPIILTIIRLTFICTIVFYIIWLINLSILVYPFSLELSSNQANLLMYSSALGSFITNLVNVVIVILLNRFQFLNHFQFLKNSMLPDI